MGRSREVRDLDSVVFDCDGVLIDVSRSYDLAIKRTVEFVTEKLGGFRVQPVTTEMIDSFKRTGGFNDEVDVTYALIIAAAASQKMGGVFQEMVNEFASNADETGIRSVDRHLETLTLDLSGIKEKMSYPARRFESPLSSVFDELFYGQELYEKLYKKSPKYFWGKGLIENDLVLVTREFLEAMHQRFGAKIAIVSGRGAVSASYSLKELFHEFDLEHSRFLEDEPREMAKPNPVPLLSAIRGMGATCSLYVGDSMEDLMMARKARQSGSNAIFCGIYGTSKDHQSKLAFFEREGADIVLESVGLLPKTLNLVGA
ncbi:MAG: phosphatase [Thaumarchaeota archaeon]|nr:phosphatase [Nitrososphaerota archaeon]